MAETNVRYGTTPRSIFGKILFKHRKIANMSRVEYAERIGKSLAQVRWIETEKTPEFEDIRDVERVFDLEPGTVYFEYLAELSRAKKE
jgi:transcriptional regulator with XRE-family HTH domain